MLFRKWEGRLGTLEGGNIPTAFLDKLDPENQIKDSQLIKSLKMTQLVSLILQMRAVKFREICKLAQDHTAELDPGQSQDHSWL